MSIPTIKIKSDLRQAGFIIINESDFNPDIHELFENPTAKATIENVECGDVPNDDPMAIINAAEAVNIPDELKPKSKAPAPRRKRRTKAEMEAARARGEK